MSDLIAAVTKRHGADSLFKLGDASVQKIDVVPTGSIALNRALGVGGYPRGRIVEIAGGPGSGKTTLALHAIAEAQKLGLGTLYVDAEHALDPQYAAAIGVDTDEMFVSQPDYGEQGLDIVEIAVTTNAVGIVVVDSVAALVPKVELDGEAGDQFVGLQARMMSQAMRRLSGAIKRSGVLVIFINQYRDKIQTFGFGGNKTTPGGWALRYAASVRMDVVRTKNIKNGDVPFAQHTKVTISKNKVAPPYRTAEFDIEFGVGISQSLELIDLGVEHKVIKRRGAWFEIPDLDIKVQGRQRLKEEIENNPQLMEVLRERIEKSD